MHQTTISPRTKCDHRPRPLAWLIAAGGLFVVLNASTASAQTVVQQPTFGVFQIGSTVLVPDGGGALLGGVNRGASGSVERGVPILGNIPYAGRLFRNRALGSTRSPSTISVHATIIDYDAMDRALLAEAARLREQRNNDPRFDRVPEPDIEVQDRADFIGRNLGRKRK